EFVAAGKSFDKKASEEWQQYQQMNGIGEYVTHNLTSVLSMIARTVGADEVAQKIEDKRGEFVAAGKSFDKKASEEWQQYQQMNSPFQYFSKNMLSVVEKTADVAHLNDVSQLVKDNRVAIEEASKKLDERLKAEYRNFKQSEGLGQYLSQRVVDAGKAMSDEQHHSTVKATVPSIRQTDAVVIPDRTVQFLHQPYNNAEIKTSESKNGLITEVTLLDGKKHGLEISWDKDGKICQINAYEHGKVVSVEGNQIEIFDEEVNGQKHTYAILNGKMFGTEKFSDKDGNLMLAFHESDGLTIPRTLTAKVSLTNVKDEDLKQKLKEDWLCSQKIMHAHSNIKTVNNYIGMATKQPTNKGVAVANLNKLKHVTR
ncbi:MAG: hypothetical protein MJ212_05190, partial [Alphaproteobacteria bacterium]|nr:hypothetical protein [Alphaproteobacteria bacterium]